MFAAKNHTINAHKSEKANIHITTDLRYVLIYVTTTVTSLTEPPIPWGIASPMQPFDQTLTSLSADRNVIAEPASNRNQVIQPQTVTLLTVCSGSKAYYKISSFSYVNNS